MLHRVESMPQHCLPCCTHQSECEARDAGIGQQHVAAQVQRPDRPERLITHAGKPGHITSPAALAEPCVKEYLCEYPVSTPLGRLTHCGTTRWSATAPPRQCDVVRYCRSISGALGEDSDAT